jgi:hypothetical protein
VPAHPGLLLPRQGIRESAPHVDPVEGRAEVPREFREPRAERREAREVPDVPAQVGVQTAQREVRRIADGAQRGLQLAPLRGETEAPSALHVDPQTDPDAAGVPAGQRRDPGDLLRVVQVHEGPLPERPRQRLVAPGGAVEDDLRPRDPGAPRQGVLEPADHLRPGALGTKHFEHAAQRVRLDGPGEHGSGVVAAGRRRDDPRAAAQRVLGDEVDRRSEPLGQDRGLSQPEPREDAVSVDRRRGGRPDRGGSRRLGVHRMSARSSASVSGG